MIKEALHAYLVYIPETGKVMKYRVVKFPTTRKGMEQPAQTERPLPGDGNLMPPPHSVSDVDRSEKVPDKLAKQPQPPDKGLRHSTRTRRPSAYLSDYLKDMEGDDQALTNVDYCYKSFAVPPPLRHLHCNQRLLAVRTCVCRLSVPCARH